MPAGGVHAELLEVGHVDGYHVVDTGAAEACSTRERESQVIVASHLAPHTSHLTPRGPLSPSMPTKMSETNHSSWRPGQLQALRGRHGTNLPVRVAARLGLHLHAVGGGTLDDGGDLGRRGGLDDGYGRDIGRTVEVVRFDPLELEERVAGEADAAAPAHRGETRLDRCRGGVPHGGDGGGNPSSARLMRVEHRRTERDRQRERERLSETERTVKERKREASEQQGEGQQRAGS